MSTKPLHHEQEPPVDQTENRYEIESVKVRCLPDGRMDTKNTALYLGVSESTLAIWRCRGEGPKFVKPSRVFYHLDDLKEWISSFRRSSSTGQANMRVI